MDPVGVTGPAHKGIKVLDIFFLKGFLFNTEVRKKFRKNT
jgi:hypothetical protein